jgi:hypothetical protein
MSASDHAARTARWNKYKNQVDTAGTRVIRATQFLVRPGLFPAYSVHEIKPLWDMWAEQKEIFCRMTFAEFKEPVFPKMPAVDAEECCFKMWGLLIQVQIDGTHGSTDILYETVRQIAKNDKCKSHPATCSCHVPDHPWVYPEDIAALAPIDPPHCLGCKCGGMERTNWCRKQDTVAAVMKNPYTTRGFPSEFCRCDTQYVSCTCGKPDKDNVDRAMLLDASGNLTPEMGQALCGKGWVKAEVQPQVHVQEVQPQVQVQPQPQVQAQEAARCEHGFIHCVVCPQPLTQVQQTKYTHRVDECACGICYKARVDAGTQEAYERKIRDRANIVLSTSRTYESVKSCLSQACLHADLAIAKASAMSGGGPDKPDFAKNLFAAMGTPHDSKCPHGLPFYACMPCSH